MSSFAIDINDKSSKAKTFLKFLMDYAKDNEFVSLEKIPNKNTRKAIKETENGNIQKIEDVDDFFNSI